MLPMHFLFLNISSPILTYFSVSLALYLFVYLIGSVTLFNYSSCILLFILHFLPPRISCSPLIRSISVYFFSFFLFAYSLLTFLVRSVFNYYASVFFLRVFTFLSYISRHSVFPHFCAVIIYFLEFLILYLINCNLNRLVVILFSLCIVLHFAVSVTQCSLISTFWCLFSCISNLQFICMLFSFSLFVYVVLYSLLFLIIVTFPGIKYFLISITWFYSFLISHLHFFPRFIKQIKTVMRILSSLAFMIAQCFFIS